MNRNRVTVYLDNDTVAHLELLRDAKAIPRGWLSEQMRRAIVNEYKKQHDQR